MSVPALADPSYPDPTPTPRPSAAPSPSPAPTVTAGPARQVPAIESSLDTQRVIGRVNGLVDELTTLGDSLKEGVSPKQMKTTVQKIDTALDSASKFMAPGGGVSQSSDRIQAKMQDAVEQLQDSMTRTEKGEGSVGMFLHDPELAQELKEVSAKASKLLTHKYEIRFVLDVGIQEIPAYPLSNSRSYLNIGIWPRPDYYYLFGVANDPRGTLTVTNTTTTDASGNSTSTLSTQVNETGFVFTGMVGKLFFDRRLDLSIGILYGDLDVSAAANLGFGDYVNRLRLEFDVYSHGVGAPNETRVNLILRPVPAIYFQVGLDGYNRVDGQLPWMYGVGLTFDDKDLRFLIETAMANVF
jgi:hypothetical protein